MNLRKHEVIGSTWFSWKLRCGLELEGPLPDPGRLANDEKVDSRSRPKTGKRWVPVSSVTDDVVSLSVNDLASKRFTIGLLDSVASSVSSLL